MKAAYGVIVAVLLFVSTAHAGDGKRKGNFGDAVRGFLGNTVKASAIGVQALGKSMKERPYVAPAPREKYVYKDSLGRKVGTVERVD